MRSPTGSREGPKKSVNILTTTITITITPHAHTTTVTSTIKKYQSTTKHSLALGLRSETGRESVFFTSCPLAVDVTESAAGAPTREATMARGFALKDERAETPPALVIDIESEKSSAASRAEPNNAFHLLSSVPARLVAKHMDVQQEADKKWYF